MTFEQENATPEEPTPGDSSSANSPDETPNGAPSATDHDSWVKQWAKKNANKNPRSAKADGNTPDATEDGTAGDAPKSGGNPEGDAHPEGDTKGKGSATFATAVGEFLERTPVRLDAKTKAELEPETGDVDDRLVAPPIEPEAELVFEPGQRPAPTTLGGKIARAFTSDKTTAALGVVGELLITGGAVVLLFLAWQLWINNAIVAGEQAEAVKNFSKNITSSPSASSLWTPKAGAIDYGPPPVLTPVGQDAVIGNLYVPRLGSGSTRSVANGVTNPGATINRGYYGKYEDSQWPGEPGNFAVAVHRNGWGTSFTEAHTIRPGDRMYLETPQGWYVYTVRNIEYVVPTQVDVVNPMPMSNAAPIDGQSILTITTCSPMNGNGERLIVYGFLSSWQPLEAGIPAEITKLVEEARA